MIFVEYHIVVLEFECCRVVGRVNSRSVLNDVHMFDVFCRGEMSCVFPNPIDVLLPNPNPLMNEIWHHKQAPIMPQA